MKRYENGTCERRCLNPAWHSLALLLLLVLIFPARSVAGDGIRPVWKEGDVWSVRVVYPVQGGGWSVPALWEYRVAGVPGSDSGGYLLEVRGLNRAPEVEARLTYRGDCTLPGVEIIRALRGRNLVTVLEYEAGAPVLTRRSLVPFDTPLFPLLASSSGEYNVKRKMLDGLSFVLSVTQGVAPDPEDEDVIEVTCVLDNGEQFVQRWRENMPWPLYGENRNMKYWLVEK